MISRSSMSRSIHLHVGRVRVPAPHLIEQWSDLVVRVGERLQHQRHVVGTAEGREVGLEQDVDSLSREGRADVEERDARIPSSSGASTVAPGVVARDSDADDADRDVDARVPEYVPSRTWT